MYVIKRDDREESEVFMFCLDKQCRDSHAQAFSGVFSPYGICNMQTASFPSIFTRSDDKTLLQKYFMTPFSFKNITDGERREKLLRILMKSPTEIRKLMTGEGVRTVESKHVSGASGQRPVGQNTRRKDGMFSWRKTVLIIYIYRGRITLKLPLARKAPLEWL